MKDLGSIRRILYCEVLYDEYARRYSINQSNYIKFIWNKFLPNGVPSAQTPVSDTALSKQMCPESDDKRYERKNIPYMRLRLDACCGLLLVLDSI